MTVLPDEQGLVVAGHHGIDLIDLRTGELRRSLQLGLGETVAIALLPDGQLLALVASAGVFLLDLHAWKMRGLRMRGNPDGLVFSVDGSR
jgi:hypothetical protein